MQTASMRDIDDLPCFALPPRTLNAASGSNPSMMYWNGCWLAVGECREGLADFEYELRFGHLFPFMPCWSGASVTEAHPGGSSQWSGEVKNKN